MSFSQSATKRSSSYERNRKVRFLIKDLKGVFNAEKKRLFKIILMNKVRKQKLMQKFNISMHEKRHNHLNYEIEKIYLFSLTLEPKPSLQEGKIQTVVFVLLPLDQSQYVATKLKNNFTTFKESYGQSIYPIAPYKMEKTFFFLLKESHGQRTNPITR